MLVFVKSRHFEARMTAGAEQFYFIDLPLDSVTKSLIARFLMCGCRAVSGQGTKPSFPEGTLHGGDRVS